MARFTASSKVTASGAPKRAVRTTSGAGVRAGGRACASASAGESPAAEAKLRKTWGPTLDAMRRLSEMTKLTWSLPMGAVVDRILEDTGWLALGGTTANGARAGHLLQAVDRVRQIVEDGGGLAAAAAALADDGQSSESEALPLEPGRRNVVRLMNLHKAKGLEATVTFLADPRGDRPFPIALRVERKGTRAVGHLRVARKGLYNSLITIGQPRNWAAFEEEEKKYVSAERLRLMYVAATRAKDLLVVCRSSKASANKAWDVFAPMLAKAPELAIAKDHPKSAETPARKVSATERAAAARAREAAQGRLTAPSWAVASVTGQATGAKTEAQGAKAEARSAKADAGAAWGSLVHGLLEHLVRHQDASRSDLERLSRWLTVEAPELRLVIPNALDLVQQIAAAPFWKDIQQAEDVQAEVPFSVAIPAGKRFGDLEASAVPTVLRGVIDVVYRAADGWRILDYKTDVSLAPGETLVIRHGHQLEHYQRAFEQATLEKVSGRGIVGTRVGKVEWA